MKRSVGEKITVSIGTAVPFEKILESEKHYRIEYIYMNMQTLFRNFYESLDDPGSIPTSSMRRTFLEELETIEAIVRDFLPGKIEPVFYHMSYKSVKRQMKYAKLKKPTTKKQIAYAGAEDKVLSWLFKQKWASNIARLDSNISGGNTRAFIITHYAVDLLGYLSFRDLCLLESYTGELKDRTQWSDKLTNPEKYGHLPFCALTIQVIGDGANMFLSNGRKFTDVLMTLAEKNNWHPATKLMKIRYDLGKWTDKYSATILTEMAMVKLR